MENTTYHEKASHNGYKYLRDRSMNYIIPIKLPYQITYI